VQQVPAPQKQKKKKKVWPWIVGVIALLLAAAVVFCIFWVNPYFTRKNAYEKAMECLEQNDFDGALENFEIAGDYEDAATYLEGLQEKENRYTYAVQAMGEDRYDDAWAAFSDLDAYRDAPQKVQECLLQLALGCLSRQSVEDASFYVDDMDEDTYAAFMEIYERDYADLQVFAILESLLDARNKAENGEAPVLYDIIKAESSGLAAIEDLPMFADPALEELVAAYAQGVQEQLGAFTEDGKIDNYDFYEGAYLRSYAVETLISEYGFLEEREDLSKVYEGTAVYFEAIMALQLALEDQLETVQTVKGADGKLEKRFVTTGKSLWGSYTEILSGLTSEDWLAFPYGKNLTEGAPTVDSEISELYNY
jgi:hypothetical protein